MNTAIPDMDYARKAAEDCLRTARELLVRDGELSPVAMAIVGSPDGLTRIMIKMVGITQEQAPGLLRQVAQAMQVQGMLLVTDGYVKAIPDGKWPENSLSVDPEALESILVLWNSPATGSWMLSQPYRRNAVGDIEFAAEWWGAYTSRMLPDWWAEPSESTELYDVARDICHQVGLPWTDPRTGVTHSAPKQGRNR